MNKFESFETNSVSGGLGLSDEHAERIINRANVVKNTTNSITELFSVLSGELTDQEMIFVAYMIGTNIATKHAEHRAMFKELLGSIPMRPMS